MLKDFEDKKRNFKFAEQIINESQMLSEVKIHEDVPLQQKIEFERSENNVVHQFIDNKEFESNSFPSQEPDSMRE